MNKNTGLKIIKKEDLELLTTEQVIPLLKKIERQNARLKKNLVKKEELLKLAEDNFNEFYNLAPICYLTLDQKGLIREINLTASELMVVDIKSALNNSFIHFLVTKDIKKFNKLLEECKHTYEQCGREFTIKNGINKSIIVQLIALPFLDYRSKKICFRIFFYDITEKKRLERLLRESEKRFRLIAEATPVMIWMTDINGRLEYMNGTETKFLGLKPGKISTDLWLNTRHPEDREIFQSELTRATKEQSSFTMELRSLNREGNYRWLISTAVPRFLENGSFVGLIGSGIDITEEKTISSNLLKSVKEKEILIKEVHHRVKNNLQIIMSLINIQSSLITDQKAIDALKTTQDRVRSMAVLHEKLYQTNNVESVNVKEYLTDLISSLFQTYRKSQEIRLVLKIAEIQLDIGVSISIGLIINELITNSLKYAFPENKKGEIEVELKPLGDHQLQIIIKDDGVGLPAGFQPDGNKSFGLMLVKVLTEQLGGTIETKLNGNTEFHINISI